MLRVSDFSPGLTRAQFGIAETHQTSNGTGALWSENTCDTPEVKGISPNSPIYPPDRATRFYSLSPDVQHNKAVQPGAAAASYSGLTRELVR